VNKTNRCTEFQFYWYYDSTCFTLGLWSHGSNQQGSIKIQCKHQATIQGRIQDKREKVTSRVYTASLDLVSTPNLLFYNHFDHTSYIQYLGSLRQRSSTIPLAKNERIMTHLNASNSNIRHLKIICFWTCTSSRIEIYAAFR